ncbi:uroporphyrin-III C-methyltransferase [Candidatus Kinetoplastibacterium oncopeltii TCC290E]|uniref:Uroporphyrin-III C-methyltransferase n=1 Tax=Candidatus Kinetoplastidibacterium stringomonadis TCC290E TaxID=1208920 RepID=M1M891_9PROT|nr:uroporphyrinogen-III C-methyltransferase [Candidatus Kinetoplastibacterium oncopeltii]AGF48220.1 uroporphyrin-III C-methyltransferase [Candidatus Kinetoplastibacterium oncopeltii TCC290E]
MRYFKKISLVFLLFFVFILLFFFLKKQVINYIEFEKLDNINKINSLEEKIINRDNDLLSKVNKVLIDIKHKQDYLFHLTNSSKDELLIKEIDRLLFIANCQLSIGKNIEGTASTLESIILFVNEVSSNNLLFKKLLEDIKIDLSALRSIRIIDTADNMERLSKLSDLIKAGLANKKFLPSNECVNIIVGTENCSDKSLVSYWSFFTNRIFDNMSKIMKSLINRLSNVIELRKVDDVPNSNYRNIDLLLIQQISIAQFSLVINQPFLLRSSMNCIIETINTFFDINATNVLEALEIARAINSLNIENKLPDISRSLNSIKKLCYD